MGVPLDLVYLRLFLGLILFSVATSKLLHPRRFRQGIQDYNILPSWLDAPLALSTLASFGIPLAELLAGIGLATGLFLNPSLLVAMCLFLLFSGAITSNLLRGRRDLSCHCGGTLGNHLISWWLVGRNALFVVALLFLLLTPPDRLTFDSFVRTPSTLSASFVSIVLPVILLVGAVLAAFLLVNAARHVLRS